MNTRSVQRRYELDWLRVLAFAAVFLYHCSRFFSLDDWEMKNAQTSSLVQALKEIFDLWGMPLIFVISGASIYFALRPGGAVRFLRDRVWRLLVPLAFGILVLAPPQIYLKRLTHGEFQGNFLKFLPLYFRDWHIWGGNFAWSGVHLWYLENLFLYTLVLLPLFAALKSQPGRRITEALAHLSTHPGVIFLWALPLGLALILLDPSGTLRPALPEDITRLLWFPPFPVYGFLVFSVGQIQQAIIRQRRIALSLAAALTMVAVALGDLEGPDVTPWLFALVMILGGLLIWSSILAILGYGMRYLTANHRLLSYANEAVLPIYILHQPVILILGYFIIPLPLSILAKYLIIVPLAFGITLGLYEFGVRRLNPIRRVFGLKPRQPALPVADLAAQPVS
jgi:glucan biosynthesis protein C